MKIVVSALTRFYLFHLARQMAHRGHLRCLFTGEPSWKVDKDLRQYAKTFPWLWVAVHLAQRLRLRVVSDEINWLALETFDRWVAGHVPECDVVVSASCQGLFTFRRGVGEGTLRVCDRASSHPLFQDQILAEEYARWGIRYRPIQAKGIRKEMQEYTESDLVTVPSTFALRTYLEHGVPASKLALLPLGADLSRFRPEPGVRVDSKFRVIFVGNLSLRKGIPDLLEALAVLRLPDFEVLLAGPVAGEVKPFLKSYDGGYRYVGPRPQRELYRWYSQASVFVMPSIEDGFGLVMAEAMACGLPVVATTNTGAEDLFTEGVEGFIVPIRSPEILRERVLHLYHNRQRCEEMGQAALARVKSLGGWNTYGERAARIFQGALERLRGGISKPAGGHLLLDQSTNR